MTTAKIPLENHLNIKKGRMTCVNRSSKQHVTSETTFKLYAEKENPSNSFIINKRFFHATYDTHFKFSSWFFYLNNDVS